MKPTALAALTAAAFAAQAAAPVPISLATVLQAEQGAIVRARLPVPGHDLTLDGRAIPLAPDGRFALGIDRDATGRAQLAWTTSDGRAASWPVAIVARQWHIDHMPARLLRPGPPDPAYDRLRTAETDAIKAARAEVSPNPFWQAGWRLPVGGRISGVFGSQRIYGEKPAAFHGGLDIAAPAGTAVMAPAPGIVRLAQGPFSLEGNVVILDHGFGLHSAFLHLSRIDVRPGTIVRQGDVIGAIGTTGRSTGPHLHWGMTWTPDGRTATRVDPASLFPHPPVENDRVTEGGSTGMNADPA